MPSEQKEKYRQLAEQDKARFDAEQEKLNSCKCITIVDFVVFGKPETRRVKSNKMEGPKLTGKHSRAMMKQMYYNYDLQYARTGREGPKRPTH